MSGALAGGDGVSVQTVELGWMALVVRPVNKNSVLKTFAQVPLNFLEINDTEGESGD